jgi:hypothetical protein
MDNLELLEVQKTQLHGIIVYDNNRQKTNDKKTYR